MGALSIAREIPSKNPLPILDINYWSHQLAFQIPNGRSNRWEFLWPCGRAMTPFFLLWASWEGDPGTGRQPPSPILPRGITHQQGEAKGTSLTCTLLPAEIPPSRTHGTGPRAVPQHQRIPGSPKPSLLSTPVVADSRMPNNLGFIH